MCGWFRLRYALSHLPGGAELQAQRVFPHRWLRVGVAILCRGVLGGLLGSKVCCGNGLNLLQNPLQAVTGVQPHSAAFAVGPQHIANLRSNVLHTSCSCSACSSR